MKVGGPDLFRLLLGQRADDLLLLQGAGLGVVGEDIDRGLELVQQVDPPVGRMEGEVPRAGAAPSPRAAGGSLGESVPVAASKRNCRTRLPPRLVASTKRLLASGWMACALGSVGMICLAAAPCRPARSGSR